MNDVIHGGRGDDKITGGDGLDVFIFEKGANTQTDTILDFDETNNAEKIQIKGFTNGGNAVDKDGLTIAQDGNNVKVTIAGNGNNGYEIILQGETASNITGADDFIFVA